MAYVAPSMNRVVIQTAYVVNDLEAAAQRWMRTLGIGPFYILNRPNISEPLYRGKPSKVEFSTAITQAGAVQIELVQQHCDNPSCYRDTIPAGQEAFHHIAVIVEDYDTELARYAALGCEVASSGRMGDMRFSFVDTSDQIEGITEILEDKSFIRDYFDNLKKACTAWDGSRPIRSADELF